MKTVPVLLLTGFLGAGKTTLLNRMIADPGFSDTALIINEFGAVGIDAMLVEQADEGIVEMSDGCLCCTIRGDLADTLERVLVRNPAPKRIVIETTGLADPTPIVQTVIGHPQLQHQVELAAVLVVLDAVNGEITLAKYQEARRQVAMADWIYLSKTDHEDSAETDLLKHLAAINPHAQILKDADIQSGLLETMLANPAPPAAKATVMQQDDHGRHHHHHHHHHDLNRHGSIRAICIESPDPIDRTGFEGFVRTLRATQGDKLLRLKALVRFSDAPDELCVVHAAQQILDAPKTLPAKETVGSSIVLVLDDASEDYVRQLYNGFMNRPAIDTADRAALESNPLSIPGV